MVRFEMAAFGRPLRGFRDSRAGVSLLEMLVVLVLVGLAVGLGAVVLSSGVRAARGGLDGAESALRALRVGDCFRFEGGTLWLLRGGRTYGRVRLPGVRAVPEGFGTVCRTAGSLAAGADGGGPRGGGGSGGGVGGGGLPPVLLPYRVCFVPERPLPASGAPVCISPVGAVVYRTPQAGR